MTPKQQAERLGAQPMLAYRRNREPWTVRLAWPGPEVREVGIAEAANAIREKLMGWP